MIRRVALVSLLLAVGSPAVRAQFGFEFGVGQNTQQGEVSSNCGCTFPSGSGMGYMSAISYEVPLFIGIRGGVKTGVDVKKTEGSISIMEIAIIQETAAGFIDTAVFVPVKRTLDVSLTYATVTTYVSYSIPGIGVFVQVGTAVSSLRTSTFRETRQLTSTSLTVNGHTINDMKFQNGTSTETIADGPVPSVNSLRVAAMFSTGYEVNLLPLGVRLSGMVTYDTPLTTVQSTSGSNWKISSVYGTIALKFGL